MSQSQHLLSAETLTNDPQVDLAALKIRAHICPKTKDIQFAILHEQEMQQILTAEKHGHGNVWHFCSKTSSQLSK